MALTKIPGSMLEAGAVAASLGYVPLAPSSIGATVQAWDADLDAISALATTAGFLKKTGAGTWAIDTTTYIASTAIGTTVQAWDLDLDAIAGLTGTSGFLKKAGPGNFTLDTNTYLTSASTLTAGNLSGTIPSAVLGNSSHFIGTTSIALNRASASQTLTGVSIDGSAASATTATNLSGGTVSATTGAFSNTLNVTGKITGSSNADIAGAITATGTAAAVYWQDRTTTTNNWAWYSSASIARLYSGISGNTGDRLTIDASGNTVASGNVTAYSDESLKTNWRDLADDVIEQMALVKMGIYDRIDTGATQVGVSAQSLLRVIAPAVSKDADGKYLTVAYGNAALAMCVALSRRVVDLSERLAAVQQKVGA